MALPAISTGMGLLIGAGLNFLGGLFNLGETRAARKEAQAMAEKEFAWNQAKDRFGMEATNRQLAETHRMNNYSVVKNSIDQLNEKLRTNVGLRDRMVSLWGGGE